MEKVEENKMNVSENEIIKSKRRIANYIYQLTKKHGKDGGTLNIGFGEHSDEQCCDGMNNKNYEIIKIYSYIFKNDLDNKRKELREKINLYDIEIIEKNKIIDYNIFKEMEKEFIKKLDKEIALIIDKYPTKKIYNCIIVSKTYIDLTLFV